MDHDTIKWATYGLSVDPDPLAFEMCFHHEGEHGNYRLTIRTASPGELPPVRIARRLLILEILPLDGIRRPDGEVNPDAYDHFRRTPWYLLFLLRLQSLHDVWINHPFHFETAFGVVVGTYGVLKLDPTLLGRSMNLQIKLNRFYEAIWPVEMVRGPLQIARQTGQDLEGVLASSGLTKNQYDKYAYITYAMRRFMNARNQHPDDYDETVVNLTSMLEQLLMLPREGDVTRKLSARAARLVCSLLPRLAVPELEGIVRHFYDERSLLLHRVYELPSRAISVSSLSEVSRVCLLAYIAFNTQGILKNAILNGLDGGEAGGLGEIARQFYGEELASLWVSEVELRPPD